MNNEAWICLQDVSFHAQKRYVQRGIDEKLTMLAVEYGEAYHAGNGTTAFWLNKKRAVRYSIITMYGTDASNIAVIISADGKVITVMHCSRRVKSWRSAA